MHELGLTTEIVDLVTAKAAEAGAARVVSVKLAIGAFSGVEPDAVAFCFEIVSKGTLAEGARLEIDRVPLTLECRGCGVTAPAQDVFAVCSSCGSTDVRVTAGREFRVDSMEVD
jgi:hydrogenase nickel incorporation protein HypA/HybF